MTPPTVSVNAAVVVFSYVCAGDSCLIATLPFTHEILLGNLNSFALTDCDCINAMNIPVNARAENLCMKVVSVYLRLSYISASRHRSQYFFIGPLTAILIAPMPTSPHTQSFVTRPAEVVAPDLIGCLQARKQASD